MAKKTLIQAGLNDHQARVLFRDKLRVSRDKFKVVEEARTWLPPKLFSEAINWVLKQKDYSNVIYIPFPKNIEQIGPYIPFSSVSFLREIEWAKSLIIFYSKKLNDFVNLKNSIETAVFNSNFCIAENLFEELKHEFGVSYWWITHNLANLQLSGGIEAQKKFAIELKKSFSSRSINEFIIHNISVRIEPSVTPARFVTQMHDEIDEFPFSEGWKEIIKYHTIGGWPTEHTKAIHVLRYSATESIVDLYEAFIYLAKVYSVKTEVSKEKQLLITALQSVNEEIKDDRLSSLIFALSNGEKGNVRLYNIEEEGSIEQNSISEIGTYIQKAIVKDNPSNISNYSDKILQHVSSILARDEHTDNSISEIDKAAVSFPGFDIISALKALLAKELSLIPEQENSILNSITEKEQVVLNNDFMYSFSSIIESHPILIKYFPSSLSKAISSYKLKNNTTRRLSATWESDNISPYRFQQYERSLENLSLALKNGDHSSILNDIEYLSNSNVAFYRTSALRIKLYYLLKNNYITECIETATTEFINNESIRHVIPLREIADKIDKKLMQNFGLDPSIVILLDMYSRYIDRAYINLLQRSIRIFLINSKILRPSRLKDTIQIPSINKFVYFLRYCCLPEALHSITTYDSTTDLLEERINILNWLIELDPKNIDEYQIEIVNRTRRIVLEARRANVEQSKIELNLEGFLREADKEIKESYERYLAYNYVEIPTAVDENISKPITHSSGPLLPNAVPKNEASQLFQSMVKDLLKIFIGDRYFGLDGFLSTRIRHNVLESELRSPLVASSLATSRNAEGLYNFNEYWLGDLAITDPVVATNIDSTLSDFLFKYDSLWQEINNDWVRVAVDDQDTGLIRLVLDYSQLGKVEELIKTHKPLFHEFAKTIFQVFSNVLELSLTNIRQQINDVAKPKALDLINELESKLQDNGHSSLILINTVRDLRGSVSRAFDRVITWFKPSYEITAEPLPFDHVVQIAVEIAKHFNPKFLANTNLADSADIHIHGGLVTMYTDIFLLLFDNAMSRAGINDNPSVDIFASIEDERIKLRVVNPIGPDIDRLAVSQRVDGIMASLQDGSYRRDMNRSSGGTGLSRIFEAIRSSLFIDSDLKAGIVDTSTFEVCFNLPLEFKLT